MTINAAVVTTFPNASWEIYAKQMLQSFVQHWPISIPLMVELDDNLLLEQVQGILNREGDCIAPGWNKDHGEFVARNKGKDDQINYRKQAVRFCHKIFAIKRALDAITESKAHNEPAPRYLIWLDADVHTLRTVTMEDLAQCLPKEGEAVSYMGRKDWDHSECGWLVFDLEKGGDTVIAHVAQIYMQDKVFDMEQWHDSWVWDRWRMQSGYPWTNLTPNATGMEVWPQSPMGKWSVHYKGPQAKMALAQQRPQRQQQIPGGGISIQTINAIPHEQIRAHIEKNQSLIKHWVRECQPTDEELIVVSAGPMMTPEDVRKELAAGKKIVAVKNALVPLKAAGIKPWCCILLDPRPHVADFIKDADPDVLWFVASQVDPTVTMELLAKGCTVWGYHASVNAGEESLTAKQSYSIVSGGSATATRGLFLLELLGFSTFTLYGYDLCFPDKMDLGALDNKGQPKYLEYSVGLRDPLYPLKRCFWTEPQFIAQFEEINNIVSMGKFKLTAYGHGMVPFVVNGQKTADLRRKELNAKINAGPPVSYDQLLKWNNPKKTNFSMKQPKASLKTRHKRKAATS